MGSPWSEVQNTAEDKKPSTELNTTPRDGIAFLRILPDLCKDAPQHLKHEPLGPIDHKIVH